MKSTRTAPKQKRYWYFVTGINFGDKTMLSPRNPSSACDGEPVLRRICMAPTAAHCLSAIGLYEHNAHVYRTTRRVSASKCWDVPDDEITKEHWLFRVGHFERIAVIPMEPIYRYMNSRGYAKGESGYLNQRREKRRIVEYLIKLDPRLARLGLSDQKWYNPKLVENVPEMVWYKPLKLDSPAPPPPLEKIDVTPTVSCDF